MTTVQVVETSVTITTASAIHAPLTYYLIPGLKPFSKAMLLVCTAFTFTAYTVVKLLITERRK